MSEAPPSVEKLFDLTDRVALVTGSAMGIGREIAQGLLELGAKVICSSRQADRAQEAAQDLSEQTSSQAIGLALDVRKEDSVQHAFEQIAEKFGRLDILVNNAGGASKSDHYHLWDRKLADWKFVIDTNLTGTFLCTRSAVGMMMSKKSGSIINISSIAAFVGRDRKIYDGLDMRPNLVDYAASKAGIIGFTRDAAAEMAPYGIRVNAISPGGINRDLKPEFVKRYADRTALGRMGKEGWDIKGAAVFLASDASAYMTGQNISVDGGFSIFK